MKYLPREVSLLLRGKSLKDKIKNLKEKMGSLCLKKYENAFLHQISCLTLAILSNKHSV